jgi:hypothetical protein
MLNPPKGRGKPAPVAKRKWELDSDDDLEEQAEPSDAMKALQAELHEKVVAI